MDDESALGIVKIWQSDNFSFSIEWSDGSVRKYRLCDLQKKCPCAGCYDTLKQARHVNAPTVRDDVRALSLKNVGQYALQIKFTSGCSAGIYSYQFLKHVQYNTSIGDNE